uniref:ANK_REP_REGION domain-containing protein n=1 Tax=Steinernema glaseri TaxID=37863 RepID=A0A1I7Y8R7_9BILA
LKDLLSRGADPNIRDECGRAPLHRAVISKSTVAVTALLSSGKINDIDAVNADNLSPLMLYAKFVHDEEMGRLLLQHGARLSFTGIASMLNFHKRTALHFAAQAGNLCAIKVFSSAKLDSGDKFDVNALDIQGKTPLILAAEYGYGQACQELIKLGADKFIEDDMQLTAEAYARQKGYTELAEYLGVAGRSVVAYKGKKIRSSESEEEDVLLPLDANVCVPPQQVQSPQYHQSELPMTPSSCGSPDPMQLMHCYSNVASYDYPWAPPISNQYSEIISRESRSNFTSGFVTPLPVQQAYYENYVSSYPSPPSEPSQYVTAHIEGPYLKPAVPTHI